MTPGFGSVPVTALIVTYNSRNTLGRTLAFLREARESGLLHCVVVDNCSSDASADFVADEHPWVHLIRSPKNLGYGRGLNLGFEQVRTPYALLMNPDVVIQPEAIRRLVRFMEDRPAAGIAGPAIRTAATYYQHAGGLPTPLSLIGLSIGFKPFLKGRRTVLPDSPPSRTDWLCGAVLLVRSECFRKVGGFDPRFFLYFEESDLCRRFRQAGFELWTVGESHAEHAAGVSARTVNPSLRNGDCLPQHYFQSRYYYLAKHHGLLAALLTESAELVLAGLLDIGRVLLKKPSRRELRSRLSAPRFVSPPKVT